MNHLSAEPVILILTPTYVPDAAAVGQQMADLASELARRGHNVRVVTARNGYDDPSLVYPARETLRGVDVQRLPFSSFGKASLSRRLFGTIIFMMQCVFSGLSSRRLAGIVITTSPPLSDLAGAIIALFRRVPILYWGMDLYAVQIMQLGKLKRNGLGAKLLAALQRFILRRCTSVVALDRFMAQNLKKWGVRDPQLLVLPPWPHDEYIQPISGANPFRALHGWESKFVFMYSGNHTTSNPLRTFLDASLAFKDDDSIRFAFVGGGVGKREVEEHIRQHQLRNVVSLPHQPLSELKNSLTAADVHIVSLGNGMVGIIHPCKVYGAMAAARPILYLGPPQSHVTDLLDRHQFGWQITHGDVEGAIKTIDTILATPRSALVEMGLAAKAVLHESLSQSILCGRLADRVESTFHLRNIQPLPSPPV